MTHTDCIKRLLSLISPQDQILFAAACAERALICSRTTDARLWNAIRIARLVALREEKKSVAQSAAREAAWVLAAREATREAVSVWVAEAASARTATWTAMWAARAAALAAETESKKIEGEQQLRDLQRYLAGRDVEPEVLAVDLDAALERGIDPVVATWAPWAQKAVMYNGVKTADLMDAIAK